MSSKIINTALEKLDTSAPLICDTITENDQPAYSSTGSYLLDFFIMSVRNTPEEDLINNLKLAYREDPRSTIALLFQLRDARKGKGEKLLTYYSLLWLKKYHPRVYLLNIEKFIDYGYYKDLCQLVKLSHNREINQNINIELELLGEQLLIDYTKHKNNFYSNYNLVPSNISLVAKWAPTLNTHFDKPENGNQAKKLARLMFKDSKTPEKDYRTMLSILRNQLKIVEKLMSENRWDEINFESVPSKAHKILSKAFGKHQAKRYQEYLEKVKSGHAKINTTGVQPHEIIQTYYNYNSPDQIRELLWTDLITKLKNSLNNFSNSISIVDVSESMRGLPMDVAISLGLIVSELSNNMCITFSKNPTLVNITGDNLLDRVKQIKNIEWGMNTDLMKVFDLLLENNLTSIDKLFIFTDMQFDQAIKNDKWTDIYSLIKKKYLDLNYTVPKIIFWNLRASCSNSFPVTSDIEGVSIISGFSPELLKCFIEDGDFTPIEILKKILQPYLKYVKL
jgi:hypothetical protein